MYQFFVLSLYNAALFLFLLLGSPWWLLRYATSDRFREGLDERFFGPSSRFPASSLRIWIHAVSVGEVTAISGLVRELGRRAPQFSVVVSTTTRTGHSLACGLFGKEHCLYFPLDFPWSVGAALRRLRPSVLVLAESELWPNLLAACHRENIPVVLVNARISDRSLPRYQRLRRLWHPFLQLLTVVQAQTSEDARRLQEIGVPAERIKLGGNLKFDIRAPMNAHLTELLKEQLPAPAKLLVCGSTLEGEERLLLEAWPRILESAPGAVMLLAPRHPERFRAVGGMLAASGLSWTRRSDWLIDPRPLQPGSVFLLDSIGELASLYSLATLAFVGGSLVPAGGHNPLEPARFGVAISMGPHYGNFREIVTLLVANHAIDILDPRAVAEGLARLFVNHDRAAELGRSALRVFEKQAGATARAADAIVTLLAAGYA